MLGPRPTSCAVALALGLAPACASDDIPVPEGRTEISVSPIPLPGARAFTFTLRTLDHDGREVSTTGPNPGAAFGAKDGITYVTVCDPGPSRLEVTLDDFAAASGDGVAPSLGPVLGPVGPVALDFTCVGGGDAYIDYTVALATARDAEDGGRAVAFGDVTCEATRSCAADAVSATVTCARPSDDGLGTSLGIADAHVVCGAIREPLAALGESQAFGGRFVASSASPADTQPWEGSDRTSASWTVTALAPDLAGCHVEATLMAAPELPGGHGAPCTAQPTLTVSLPLAVAACEAEPALAVGYRDGPSFTAEVVVDPRGAYTPTGARWPARCDRTGAPSFGAPTDQGLVDVDLRLAWPDAAP